MPYLSLSPRFDIFRIEYDGSLGRRAVRRTIEEAVSRAFGLSVNDHANYLILDSITGREVSVPFVKSRPTLEIVLAAKA